VNEKKRPCSCASCDFRDVVFSYLTDPAVEELCDHKEEQFFRKGEIINHEGEKISNFKYLKSGLVKLYRRTSTGEEQVITITRPFEFVSNMSIFFRGKVPVFCFCFGRFSHLHGKAGIYKRTFLEKWWFCNGSSYKDFEDK